MQKCIVSGIVGLAFLAASVYAAKNFDEKPPLERALLEKAIKFDAAFDPERDKSFRQTILSAQDIYSPKEFQDFITTEDADGWNIMMHYASNGQVEQLVWLFDLLKKMYGADQQTLFDIVYEKDKLGRTPLYVAVMRKQPRMVETLLQKSQELFGNNKDLYYLYSQSGDDLKKWSPLMLAAYLNEYETMKSILKHEIAVFGPGSVRLQRNLRKAFALADAQGKRLIQQYHNFPEVKGQRHEAAT